MATEMIRDIRVNMSEFNACHNTLEDLYCDICGKQSPQVIVHQSPGTNDIKFACMNFRDIPQNKNKKLCSQILSERMLFDNPQDDYLLTCLIKDIHYDIKKIRASKCQTKAIRAEMTLKQRYKILKRDNFSCVLCNKRPPEVTLEVDHIIPVAKGGDNSDGNLRTLCSLCNRGKGVD